MCAVSSVLLMVGLQRQSRRYRAILALGLLALAALWSYFVEYQHSLPIGLPEEAYRYYSTALTFPWMPGICCGLALAIPSTKARERRCGLESTRGHPAIALAACATTCAFVWDWVADGSWTTRQSERSMFGHRFYEAGYPFYGTAYTAIMLFMTMNHDCRTQSIITLIGGAIACVGCMAVGWETAAYGGSCFDPYAITEVGLEARAGRAALVNWCLTIFVVLYSGLRFTMRKLIDNPDISSDESPA